MLHKVMKYHARAVLQNVNLLKSWLITTLSLSKQKQARSIADREVATQITAGSGT
jgi:hypothetical protein